MYVKELAEKLADSDSDSLVFVSLCDSKDETKLLHIVGYLDHSEHGTVTITVSLRKRF